MTPEELSVFKQKALFWANQSEVCCCLDSNSYVNDPYKKYDFLIAAGARQQLTATAGTAFDQLREFRLLHQQWMFGFLGYDLKNELEDLRSIHTSGLDFPDLFFFVPEYLIKITGGVPEIILGPDDLIEQILSLVLPARKSVPPVNVQAKMSRASYLTKVEELRASILQGDIYEINFCQEFFALEAAIDPYQVFMDLNQLSPTPFAGFFKWQDQYILSASPERFLCKRGEKLYSQPIKGTAKRSPEPEKDLEIKTALQQDVKERAENVMIVDLVRNDMTRCAKQGSVKVEELFGIYTFPQVHQMISTVSCTLNSAVHPVEAIKAIFPMGSMTGAPKLRAMELIENKELSRRGIYSGAMGYFDDQDDFDFNVVIRSILYNHRQQYLSFQVGGAITYASRPQAEYEECLVKASAIVATLNLNNAPAS